jgi:hypothetical protein
MNYLEKVLEFKSGALLVLSAPASWGITELFQILFQGVKQKDLVMPLVVVGVGLFCFSLLHLIDLRLGTKAAKKNGLEITNEKLWESFWKFFSVLILFFCMTMFSFLFIAMGLNKMNYGFLLLMLTIMIVICLYEFHSIGKNLKILYKKKPSHFSLLEKIADAIENGIIKKISNLFN